MAEYIERELVIKKLDHFQSHLHTVEGTTAIGVAKTLIDEIPAADVRPVVRAAWQSWEQDKPPCKWYSCDYCGFHALSKSNYCPNCGARMDAKS